MQLAIQYTPTPGFPAAAAVAAILISAVGALPANSTPITQTVAPATASATFAGLAADTWTFTATPVDVNGNPLTASGYTPPSTTFTSAGGTGGTGGTGSTVTLNVPSALAATGP
jgi:hypothetical protein